MLENIRNAITRLPMDRVERNLGGRIPSCSRHVRHVAVAMATAHWTFCSYGRLEAERLDRFGEFDEIWYTTATGDCNDGCVIIKIFKI